MNLTCSILGLEGFYSEEHKAVMYRITLVGALTASEVAALFDDVKPSGEVALTVKAENNS